MINLTGRFGTQDLPKGVALEWGLRLNPTFDFFYKYLPHNNDIISANEMRNRMSGITADILSITDIDDEFATPLAIDRLMKYFVNSNNRYVQLDPSIGHVGFFNKKYEESLWPLSAEFLIKGTHVWKDMDIEELTGNKKIQ